MILFEQFTIGLPQIGKPDSFLRYLWKWDVKKKHRSREEQQVGK